MSKAAYFSERIYETKSFREENLASLVISNYGTKVITVYAKGVTREVPAIDPAISVPIFPFRIESFGHGFDLDFTVNIPDGIGDVVIDFIKLKTC